MEIDDNENEQQIKNHSNSMDWKPTENAKHFLFFKWFQCAFFVSMENIVDDLICRNEDGKTNQSSMKRLTHGNFIFYITNLYRKVGIPYHKMHQKSVWTGSNKKI